MYVLLFSASYVEIKRIVKEDVNCFCTKLFKTCCLCSKLLLGLHFRDVVLLSTNEFKIKPVARFMLDFQVLRVTKKIII